MSDTERDVFTPDGRKIHGARRVLPGDTQDDFLAWAHDSTGENPLAWQASARDLLEAAMAVKARVQPVEDGLMHTLAAVQAMLLGMASECLFKGMYIKRHKVWLEPDKAHALVKNGKYVGIPGVKDNHDLLRTADAAGVPLNEQERSVVERLSDSVVWAGRYPIHKRVEKMEPIKTHDGQTVARCYISRDELESAEALVKRLMREVEPWTL